VRGRRRNGPNMKVKKKKKKGQDKSVKKWGKKGGIFPAPHSGNRGKDFKMAVLISSLILSDHT
jgi:hypothetical protein